MLMMMLKIVEILFALWSLIVVKGLAASPRSQSCEEGDLPTSGSLHAQLTLLCNKTHILSTFDVIDAARESWYYSYFVYIDCVNVNGSQSVAVVLLDGVFSSVDTHNFVHVVSLHPGSECTLFGCYKNYTSGRPSFYTMDPAHCIVDEDECLMDTHLCSDWADCSNTIGGYNCSCWRGYDGDGFNCSDINECSAEGQICSEYAVCNNTPGRYSCSCLNGYDGDGFECTDVDECFTNTSTCGGNATCVNVIGSYLCLCEEGYILYYQNECIVMDEVDECSLGASTCSVHARCVDTSHGYLCVCVDNYEGDGFNCTEPQKMKKAETAMLVTVLVLLCLVTSSVVLVIICTINTRKKQPWLYWLKGEWGEQVLDKHFSPVDPTLTLSRSLHSVIEPLQIEHRQTLDTSVCASQSTSDDFESEAVSSSCTSEKEMREQDENTCTCISDGECTPSNISTEKFHCLKCTIFDFTKPCTCQTLSASVFHVEDKKEERYTLKDESGYMSDTSSSVYLSFYKLSNK